MPGRRHWLWIRRGHGRKVSQLTAFCEPGKRVIKVDLRRTKVTDADLEILEAYQVRNLNLRHLDATETGTFEGIAEDKPLMY